MRKKGFEESLITFEYKITLMSSKYTIAGMDKNDISQEIRQRLWENRNKFDDTKSSFSHWASRVAKNCIKNLYRDSKTKKASYLNNAMSIHYFDNYDEFDDYYDESYRDFIEEVNKKRVVKIYEKD